MVLSTSVKERIYCHLRFSSTAPQPHDGWSGVYNATEDKNIAVQIEALQKDNQIVGDEDCLWLHIYVPKISTKNGELKPVMVFIHGGGFQFGHCNSSYYGPDLIIERDVILVTISYRLNVFGFLNLGLVECPGNVGLKDQALAFKWIKENIKSFGGNPYNITAFGESSGSASVHYHMISPLGKGLFDRAILQSGSALNTWAYCPIPSRVAFTLGKVLGMDTTDRVELLQFLLNLSSYDLIKGYAETRRRILKSDIPVVFPFSPSIENLNNSADDAYLPDEPEILASKAISIPVIAGLCDMEGVIMLIGAHPERMFNYNYFDRILPVELKKYNQTYAIIDEVKKFYFNNEELQRTKFPEFINMLSDISFSRSFYETVNPIIKHPSGKPVYIYNFSYESDLNYFKTIFSHFLPVPVKGTVHGDVLPYIFIPHSLLNSVVPEDAYRELNLKIANTVVSYWTNFAKTGNPNSNDMEIEWIPTTNTRPCFLHINDDIEMEEGRLFNNRIEFWENLERNLKINNKYFIKTKL